MHFENIFVNFQPKAINVGGIVSALIMLTLPFSTSIPIILSGILLFIWLISSQFLSLPGLLKSNLVALLALLLFVYLFIGIGYSSATLGDSVTAWIKYRELLLFVILLPFVTGERNRQRSIRAFIAGSIGTLLVSYLMYFNFIPRPLYAATFKSIITHSIMVAFFAFYCAQQLPKQKSRKLLWGVLLLIALHNLYFIAFGRTGQLLMILLVLLFCFQHLNIKYAVGLILIFILFFTLLINYSSTGYRLTEGIGNVLNYDPTHPETETSMGRRLTFWKRSLSLIKEKPIFGHGTGSYEKEYFKIAPAHEYRTKNPHSDYLLLTVQLGITGLLIFLGFLGSQYWCSLKLANDTKYLAQGVLVTIATSSMFNSAILDHTEGHWFACLLALFFGPVGRQS